MKQIVAISLSLLLLAVAMSDMVMYLSFKLNQEIIAKTLCINVEKPKTKCHGKCYLSKKIEEKKDKNTSKTPYTVEEPVRLLFCQSPIIFVPNDIPHIDTKPCVMISLVYDYVPTEDIFHPPILSA